MEKTTNVSETSIHQQSPTPWEPYRNPRTIRSAGRTSLPAAFSNYMALGSGMSPEEIAEAYDDAGDGDDREIIEREIHFLAGVFLDGRIKTFARLIGGGEPIELTTSTWEIDQPVARFATGSLNLERPHDPLAEATHWIFVDSVQWDAAMAGLGESRVHPAQAVEPVDGSSDADRSADYSAAGRTDPTEGSKEEGAGARNDNLAWRCEIVTLEGVIKATGLKKSTIYAKINAGTFPSQITIHGSRRGWRRGEIHDWLESLTAKN